MGSTGSASFSAQVCLSILSQTCRRKSSRSARRTAATLLYTQEGRVTLQTLGTWVLDQVHEFPQLVVVFISSGMTRTLR